MNNAGIRNKMIRRAGKGTDHRSDEMLIKLAEYYTRAYAGTVERMHLTESQKAEAISAANMEYNELCFEMEPARLGA